MEITLSKIIEYMEEIAPPGTALPWDNVGMQVGEPEQLVNGVLLALDSSLRTVDEALDNSANLIITHHPLIFKPLKRINFTSVTGRIIRRLITHKIALYSAHTNLDRSVHGTGKSLAELLELKNIAPYTDNPDDEKNMVVTGRFDSPKDSDEVVRYIKDKLSCKKLTIVGEPTRTTTVAIIPGGGGSFIKELDRSFDLIITGEISYHDALEALYTGRTIIAPGHYITEKPAIYKVAGLLEKKFPGLPVKVAAQEGEPYKIL